MLREAWRPHPLAWLHRAEARGIAAELDIPLSRYTGKSGGLLRLSDPVMLRATEALTRAGIPYIGPGAGAMQLCYDKLAATQRVATVGIECPASEGLSFPLVVKPRRGSDSLGVRILHTGPVPRSNDLLVQEFVIGMELTVAVLRDLVGTPLRIALPEGTPYSFAHKYLFRARREPITDSLGARVRHMALKIAKLLGVDWAARVDFIYDPRRDRLCFLECDVAPMLGVGSAFADSLLAAGIARDAQLRLILGACS